MWTRLVVLVVVLCECGWTPWKAFVTRAGLVLTLLVRRRGLVVGTGRG